MSHKNVFFLNVMFIALLAFGVLSYVEQRGTVQVSVIRECGERYCFTPLEGSSGMYYSDNNSTTGLLWCSSIGGDLIAERGCLHEVGHFLDDVMGRVSRTNEFKSFIDKFYEENNLDEYNGELRTLEGLIATFPGIGENETASMGEVVNWGGYTELYADIYSYWISGYIEIPDSFLVFFGRGVTEWR